MSEPWSQHKKREAPGSDRLIWKEERREEKREENAEGRKGSKHIPDLLLV